MSHEQFSPSNNNSSSTEGLDVSKPYLMHRTNTDRIEVWHVKTDDEGNPLVDEYGRVWMRGQRKEQRGDRLGYPTKPASMNSLSDTEQSARAEALALDRPGLTPEQMERYVHIESELADTALADMGIDDPEQETNNEDLHDELTSLIDQLPLSKFNDVLPVAGRIVNDFRSMIEQAQHMLATANYQGVEHARRIAPQISEMIQVMRKKGAQLEDLASTTRTDTRRTEAQMEESGPALRAIALAREDEDTLLRVRRLDDAVAELGNGARMMIGAHEEVASILNGRSMLENAVNALLNEHRGHEYSIAQVRSELHKLEDSLGFMYRGSRIIDTSVEDIHRAKK